MKQGVADNERAETKPVVHSLHPACWAPAPCVRGTIQGKRAARARSRKQGSMHGDYARVGRAEVVCVVFAGCCRGFEVVGILRGPKVVRVLVFKAEVVRAFAMRHDCIRALFAHNAAPHSGAENIMSWSPRNCFHTRQGVQTATKGMRAVPTCHTAATRAKLRACAGVDHGAHQKRARQANHWHGNPPWQTLQSRHRTRSGSGAVQLIACRCC